jgi:CDP-glucose 4,6-dehydratase
MEMKDFFKGKRVFVTGHTGFKGAWLSIWLTEMGAKVIGYSLDPPYADSVYELAKLSTRITDLRGDIRDLDTLDKAFQKHKPDIVFHLAAQAIVRRSYDQPRETFETNVMGTINVIECVRKHNIRSAVFITSDKCYKNVEVQRGYKEDDPLSDHDPYSTSKACAEMAAQCYRYSFKFDAPTARAGNVIGGGDWAPDRLVPDVIRSLQKDKAIVIRSPNATRPWQHVLEPLSGYLMLAKAKFEGEPVNSGWNFGPERSSMLTVKEVVQAIIKRWGSGTVVTQPDTSKPEAGLLFLDNNKAKDRLGWHPRLNLDETLDLVVGWYKDYEHKDVYRLCADQIRRYEEHD